MDIAWIAVMFAFGTVVGSFLNVVILRLPEDEPLTGRSHCPRCGHVLGGGELVPLLSFLALGRRCRSCSRPISWRYFTVELVTGLLFATTWALQRPDGALGYVQLAAGCVLVSTLVVVFVVDLEHYLILDKVLLSGGVMLLLLAAAADWLGREVSLSLSSRLAGGLLAGGLAALPLLLLWAVSRGRWLGFGDVKYVFFLGLALGWPNIGVAWLLSFFLGAVFSAVVLALGKKSLSSRLPFGTFLSAAALLALWWGPDLLRWYLSILGI